MRYFFKRLNILAHVMFSRDTKSGDTLRFQGTLCQGIPCQGTLQGFGGYHVKGYLKVLWDTLSGDTISGDTMSGDTSRFQGDTMSRYTISGDASRFQWDTMSVDTMSGDTFSF